DQIEALTLADRIAVMKGGEIQQLDDPTTIYNRPKNLYVAGFIGSPSMNFIKSNIVVKGKSAVLQLAGGEIDLDEYKSIAPMSANAKTVFGARPEHIKINGRDEKGMSKPFDAVVELVEPMGSDTLVWLKFGGQTISVRVESSEHYKPEDAVKLRFRMGLASLFDEASGDRI
ncbi:MAG: TOBE domain-containing protein, partial [Rhizobiaceae bacterium]